LFPNGAKPQPEGRVKKGFSRQNGVGRGPEPEENAAKTLARFVVNLSSPIVAVLSCFNRVIFKPHLPMMNGTDSKASSITPTERARQSTLTGESLERLSCRHRPTAAGIEATVNQREQE